MDLARQVKTNLVHFHLWTDVEVTTIGTGCTPVLRGQPPAGPAGPSARSSAEPSAEPSAVSPGPSDSASGSAADLPSTVVLNAAADRCSQLAALRSGGNPPATSDSRQWVVPVDLAGPLEPSLIDRWFSGIAAILGRPNKLLVAIVGDDSSVVYYNVHDGVATPQN